MGKTIQTDVAIIGAGPVGLFAAFECGMLKLESVLIDALAEIGGQCTALYPEKPIYDIPAHPAIAAGHLISNLEQQIAPFDVKRLLGRRVDRLEGEVGDFVLGTDAGDEVRCKAVVLAAGAGAFGPNRPPLAGIEAFEATGGVQYLVRRREEFRGARVVIAGGGDSAVDWALSLKDVAAKVMVVHRRAKFRAAPETAAQLEAAAAAGALELVTPFQLDSLRGTDGRLEAVGVRDLNGTERLLEADHLLAFFGLSMDLGPIAGWGLGIEHSHVRIDPSTCQTSTPGVFAVGDVATYAGKLKLILQGFSEGAVAAHAIHPIVYPDTALHFEYSTSKGVPADSVDAIAVERLTKRYGDVLAVAGLDFAIPAGRTLGLLGGNGAGKTTTIAMLLGLLIPSGGRIRILGHDMATDRFGALARMNFSSPYIALPARLSVAENLRVYGHLYSVRGLEARIAALAETLDLRGFLDRPAGQLSAGQKTRVTLAKALINRPDVLLLDEPTASLDPDTGDSVRSALEAYRAETGCTILLASHNMAEVERLCDDVLMLKQGRAVDRGTPAELLGRYGHDDLEQVFLDIARNRGAAA